MIGQRVPGLNPSTLGGAAYNFLTAAGTDPYALATGGLSEAANLPLSALKPFAALRGVLGGSAGKAAAADATGAAGATGATVPIHLPADAPPPSPAGLPASFSRCVRA